MDHSSEGEAGVSRVFARSPITSDGAAASTGIPDYLEETYHWAYLSKLGRVLLDRSVVVSGILWGNAGRLIRATTDELRSGERVLQPACVYGSFSRQLAAAVGGDGSLDVIDVAPIQVQHCRRKLKDFPQARVHLANAATWDDYDYHAVCCFFLLHEVPEDYKHRIVNNLLGSVSQGGKVVFVDYHRPHHYHPLKGIMRAVFGSLEPYAHSLWEHEISSYAEHPGDFSWSKRTYFGGLYQKVVAQRN